MTFSATRVATWMACNRKAAWQYFMGYEEPETTSTSMGSEVHARLEAWKHTGMPIDRTDKAGAIASEATPHVPPGGQIEGQFMVQGRHLWTGYKDLRFPGLVIDYKTTSDFKWAKSPEELLYDPQAILYAESEFRLLPGLDAVSLLWLYLRTRAPFAAHIVNASVSREHAAKAFSVMESYADDMQKAANQAPKDIVERHAYVLKLAPNFDHCDAYGGCPHRARCNAPFFHEKKEIKPMNLLERLMTNAPTPPPAMTMTPAAVTAGLPPMSSPPMLAPDPVANGPGNPHPTTARSDIPELPVPGVAQAMPVAAATPEITINPPSKRGRGRPKKGEAGDIAAAKGVIDAMSGMIAEAISSAPVPSTASPDVATENAKTIMQKGYLPVPSLPDPPHVFALFVGCMPRGMTCTDFDTLVAKAKIMLGPIDYRLIDFEGPGNSGTGKGNFGKGNGLLLDAVKAVVNADKPEFVVVSDPRTPEATLCLSFLRGQAGSVVEALR